MSADQMPTRKMTKPQAQLLAYMQAGVPEMRATGDNGLPDDAPDFPLLGNSGALPASVDLSVECAPINDQLQWGSCTAFAVGDGASNGDTPASSS